MLRSIVAPLLAATALLAVGPTASAGGPARRASDAAVAARVKRMCPGCSVKVAEPVIRSRQDHTIQTDSMVVVKPDLTMIERTHVTNTLARSGQVDRRTTIVTIAADGSRSDLTASWSNHSGNRVRGRQTWHADGRVTTASTEIEDGGAAGRVRRTKLEIAEPLPPLPRP
jgi:hypothetical protein